MYSKCESCRDGDALTIPFTMAFQPIVDYRTMRIWGYEALVRGPAGASAASVLDQITDATLYKFDQACRVRAIELAGAMLPDDETRLSINFMPNAVYEPSACIQSSLKAARRVRLRPDRLMFEFTEHERFPDTSHIANIVAEYKRRGFMTAIDDFGSGFAGLTLLAKLQPDLIKIDMDLIRRVDGDGVRRAIVAGIIAIARSLGIELLAEGVETAGELAVLRAAGVDLFQGYYFAKPVVENLPVVPGFSCGPIGAANAAA